MGNKRKNKEVYIRITPKVMMVLVLLFWTVSLVGTWFVAKQITVQSSSKGKSYSLLNPRLNTSDFDTPEERNARLFATLAPLKDQILKSLGDKKEDVAFYVEDLNSGSWIGWKEKDPFIAASLLKTPLAIGAMKKVDKGEWTLETTFVMDSKYKDDKFGDFYETPDGTTVTLRKVMEEMLQDSDNTAAAILLDNLTLDERADVFYHIGVSNPEDKEVKPLFAKLLAKELASMFRALYNSTFLKRQSSEYILNLLTETKFDQTKSPKIPKDIKFAHKIGNFLIPNYKNNYHDCGVVYIPNRPYLYCTMTQNFEAKPAEGILSDLSYETYLYFVNDGKNQ